MSDIGATAVRTSYTLFASSSEDSLPKTTFFENKAGDGDVVDKDSQNLHHPILRYACSSTYNGVSSQ